MIRRALQPFASLFGHAFRLLPRRLRYPVAFRIAMLLAPLIRRTPFYDRRPSRLDGAREWTLRMVLRTMTRTGVPFDPSIEVRGRELVPERGCLLVSGHFLLNIHISRWMHDAGRVHSIVIGGPREPLYYSGTSHRIEVIELSPAILVQLRSRVRAGEIVFCDIESSRRNDSWMPLETAAGVRWISPVMFRFAARAQLPVVFGATRIERDRVVTTYARPSSSDADGMLREFAEFLRGEIARVVR